MYFDHESMWMYHKEVVAQCSTTTKVVYEGVKKCQSKQYRESNTYEAYRNYVALKKPLLFDSAQLRIRGARDGV